MIDDDVAAVFAGGGNATRVKQLNEGWTRFSFAVPQASYRLEHLGKYFSPVFYTPNQWPWRICIDFNNEVHTMGGINNVACYLEMGDAPFKPDRPIMASTFLTNNSWPLDITKESPFLPPERKVEFEANIVEKDGQSMLADYEHLEDSHQSGQPGNFILSHKPGQDSMGFRDFCAKDVLYNWCISSKDTITFVALVRPDTKLSTSAPTVDFIYLATKQILATSSRCVSSLELSSAFSTLWALLDAHNVQLPTLDHRRAVFQALFTSMPPIICANWYRRFRAGDATVENVPSLLHWLAEEHSKFKPNAGQCGVCMQQKHRGRCEMHFTREFILASPHKVVLSARPLVVQLEAMRFQEEDKVDAQSNPTAAAVAIGEALREADNAISQTSQSLDDVINLVERTHLFIHHGTKFDKVREFERNIAQSLGALAESCTQTNMDMFKTESNLIQEGIVATQAAIKQGQDNLEDKLKSLRDVEQMDRDIAKCTVLTSKRTKEKEKAQRELELSKSHLMAAKKDHDKRLADLARALNAAQEAEKETRHIQQQIAKARQDRNAAKRKYMQAKQEHSNTTTQQYQVTFVPAASSPPLLPKQQAPLAKYECMICKQDQTQSSVSWVGIIRPCSHIICLDCFTEAEEASHMIGVPFLHTHCSTSGCDAVIQQVNFDSFSFDPTTGKRRL